MTENRLKELLKAAVSHIENFEEDESKHVLLSLGFTEKDLHEIQMGYTEKSRQGSTNYNKKADERMSETSENTLRKAFVLICTHETKYGVSTFASIHPNTESAIVAIDDVKIQCDYDEEHPDAGEYFDTDIKEQLIDFSLYESVKDSKSKEQPREDEEISVSTPYGDIVVTSKMDGDYPGVYVDLKGDKVNDVFRVGESSLAMIEYDPNKKKVQAVVYGDAKNEEPTSIIEYENLMKERDFDLEELLSAEVDAVKKESGSLGLKIHSAKDRAGMKNVNGGENQIGR